MDPWPGLPLYAPLASDQVWDLLAYREETLPKERPQRGENLLEWHTQRLLRVQELLVSDAAAARSRVYALLDPIVRRDQLTRRWLVDTLYPPPLTTYPDRLREWREENFLLFDQNGEPEPQTTAAILLQRELDDRRRRLPHPRPAPRSFYCWRQDVADRAPVPYELPLVLRGGESDRSTYVLRPEPGSSPYFLFTAWKGVSWEDPAWLVYDEVAVRWVGEPTEEMLASWLSAQDLEQLSASKNEQQEVSRSRLALVLLAGRLNHHQFSGL